LATAISAFKEIFKNLGMENRAIAVQQISFQPYCLPFRQPFQTALGVWRDRHGFVIEVIDDCGRRGLGEAAPLAGFGMETLAETEVALAGMRELFLGVRLSNLKDLQHLLEEYAHVPAAKHGMELALLDLLAQAQSVPIAQLLNPNFCENVRVNATIGAMSLEATARRTEELITQGYQTLKLKVGVGDFEQDLLRLKTVRSLANSEIQIRIDVNQAWSVEQAIANLRRLECLNLEYVEQPVIASDLAGMAKVRKSVAIAIAADESVTNLVQLEKIISLQAADLVILKPMAMGGILTTFQAAQIAFEHGLDVVVTTTLDGAIARQGALHLAVALRSTRACILATACGLATGALLTEDVCADYPKPRSGCLFLPKVHGLGLVK
jgi:o-succinylbenzoate synthase